MIHTSYVYHTFSVRLMVFKITEETGHYAYMLN
jgi:hypothetical protein